MLRSRSHDAALVCEAKPSNYFIPESPLKVILDDKSRIHVGPGAADQLRQFSHRLFSVAGAGLFRRLIGRGHWRIQAVHGQPTDQKRHLEAVHVDLFSKE